MLKPFLILSSLSLVLFGNAHEQRPQIPPITVSQINDSVGQEITSKTNLGRTSTKSGYFVGNRYYSSDGNFSVVVPSEFREKILEKNDQSSVVEFLNKAGLGWCIVVDNKACAPNYLRGPLDAFAYHKHLLYMGLENRCKLEPGLKLLSEKLVVLDNDIYAYFALLKVRDGILSGNLLYANNGQYICLVHTLAESELDSHSSQSLESLIDRISFEITHGLQCYGFSGDSKFPPTLAQIREQQSKQFIAKLKETQSQYRCEGSISPLLIPSDVIPKLASQTAPVPSGKWTTGFSIVNTENHIDRKKILKEASNEMAKGMKVVYRRFVPEPYSLFQVLESEDYLCASLAFFNDKQLMRITLRSSIKEYLPTSTSYNFLKEAVLKLREHYLNDRIGQLIVSRYQHASNAFILHIPQSMRFITGLYERNEESAGWLRLSNQLGQEVSIAFIDLSEFDLPESMETDCLQYTFKNIYLGAHGPIPELFHEKFVALEDGKQGFFVIGRNSPDETKGGVRGYLNYFEGCRLVTLMWEVPSSLSSDSDLEPLLLEQLSELRKQVVFQALEPVTPKQAG